jgi:hypothetical protein
MARPNVKFKIIDESLVVPITEGFSSTIGAVWNPTVALKVLAGTTAERTQGYFFVQNSSEWYGRLTDYIVGLQGGIENASGNTFYSVGSCAASYLNGTYTGTGISAGFSGEWWPVNNYLQYGGGCYVGFGSTPTNDFKQLGFDLIFQGGNSGADGNLYGNYVTTVVEERSGGDQPVIGIVYTPSSTNAPAGLTFPSGSNSYNYIRVYGEKLHLDTSGLYTIETPLAADVAGCLVRTDRDAFPWFSPAGDRRGRILNVLRLKRNLTPSEQDTVYSNTNRANAVVTFPGSGTILFGDKTGETETSTLSRINVSRLFMYIKKALAPVARSILFEQNDSITRTRFKVAAEGFLDRIVGQRGIQAYRVVCDSSNNTPEIVEANYFVADILIKPVTSINYVTITLTNKDLSSIF